MTAIVNQILLNQFEASLCMLKQCIQACPPRHWEDMIANATFRQVAYHTLFFVDYYLTRRQGSFRLRELHRRGGDERRPTVSKGLSQQDTLDYLALCRAKAIETLESETSRSLAGASGFKARKFSRCELHIYSIRHIQHHTGQLSAFLRRIKADFADSEALRWIGSGWR